MNAEAIVDLVHEGYLETEITVYTNFQNFTGEWFAVNTNNKTICITIEEGSYLMIDFSSIVAIEIIKQE